MKDQKLNINVEKGVKELVIIEGEPKPVRPFRSSIFVNGCIDVVSIHLTDPSDELTKLDEASEIPLQYSYVQIDRDEMSIIMFEDKGMPWESQFSGKLELDENLIKFGINSGKSYTAMELSDFFRMNRSFFETKDKAMSLVSQLRSFRVKVDKELEDKDDRRGNRSFLISQAVEHNIPESFKLVIPVFKNFPKQTIEVEVNIDSTDFSCKLISPELNDFIIETRNEIIDEEKSKIKELFPSLRVFEV